MCLTKMARLFLKLQNLSNFKDGVWVYNKETLACLCLCVGEEETYLLIDAWNKLFFFPTTNNSAVGKKVTSNTH